MALKVAERWFDYRRIGDDITLLWEPYVSPLLRCNIWHVRGRDRDLMIDTGLGVASLREATREMIDNPVLAVATHTHVDHVGGHHEFDQVLVHKAEAESLMSPSLASALYAEGRFSDDLVRALTDAGYAVEADFISALPAEGFSLHDYRVKPAPPTRLLEEGDAIDTGDRRFQVLHLPGHSPGSIGLWEAASGILFSGDCIYDGALLDTLDHSDIDTYRESLRRLKELPVTVVHAGHEPSFGRQRLHALIDAYLKQRPD